MTTTQNTEDLFNEVVNIYDGSHHIYAHVDEDMDLLIKSYITPGGFISTIVHKKRDGYIIHTRYFVGTEVARNTLVDKINEINSNLIEGCLYVDDDGDVAYRTFLRDNGALDARAVAKAVKIGIVTFLENLNDIMGTIRDLEAIRDSEFSIVTADGVDR